MHIDDWLSGGSCMMSDDPVIKSLALFFEAFRMPARKKAEYIKLLQFNKFKCKFEGRTMYLTGCSRMVISGLLISLERGIACVRILILLLIGNSLESYYCWRQNI